MTVFEIGPIVNLASDHDITLIMHFDFRIRTEIAGLSLGSLGRGTECDFLLVVLVFHALFIGIVVRKNLASFVITRFGLRFLID